MDIKPSLIKFRYHQNESVYTHTVSGIQTAGTPDGKVVVRFFTENPALAKSETWKTNREGALAEQVEVEPAEEQIIREILTVVKMDQNTARALCSVITTQLENMKRAKGEQ